VILRRERLYRKYAPDLQVETLKLVNESAEDVYQILKERYYYGFSIHNRPFQVTGVLGNISVLPNIPLNLILKIEGSIKVL
jgi:hypothetical protein